MDLKMVNIPQTIEQIRHFWIHELKESNKETQDFYFIFWKMYLWYLKITDDCENLTHILSEGEYIDIFTHICKHGKVDSDREIIQNTFSKISTDMGRYIAYKRMIVECKKEFVEEYLSENCIYNNDSAKIMFSALIETKWKNDSDIYNIMDNCNAPQLLEYVFNIKSKLALFYILKHIKTDEIIKFSTSTGHNYCFTAPFLLFLFSKGGFLYNSMIYLCLKIRENDSIFMNQLSFNIFNNYYLDDLFDSREDAKLVFKDMFKEFIWFLLEIDFYKYLSKNMILYRIEKFNKTIPTNRKISLNKIKRRFTKNKNKLNNIIDNGYAPYIPKEVVGIIKKYMVFYEHMLKT